MAKEVNWAYYIAWIEALVIVALVISAFKFKFETIGVLIVFFSFVSFLVARHIYKPKLNVLSLKNVLEYMKRQHAIIFDDLDKIQSARIGERYILEYDELRSYVFIVTLNRTTGVETFSLSDIENKTIDELRLIYKDSPIEFLREEKRVQEEGSKRKTVEEVDDDEFI